jgi:hypothetical protein
MEHQRANGHQWVDRTIYMVFDKFSGIQRVGGSFLVGYNEAMDYVTQQRGWENRLFVVKADVIAAYKLEAVESNNG